MADLVNVTGYTWNRGWEVERFAAWGEVLFDGDYTSLKH
jgi:hypothetical protein